MLYQLQIHNHQGAIGALCPRHKLFLKFFAHIKRYILVLKILALYSTSLDEYQKSIFLGITGLFV